MAKPVADLCYRCAPTALPYTWRQTLQDLTVTIAVPAGSKSRDLVVEIKKKSLKVALKTGTKEVFVQGELCKEIKTDDSTWTLGSFGSFSCFYVVIVFQRTDAPRLSHSTSPRSDDALMKS